MYIFECLEKRPPSGREFNPRIQNYIQNNKVKSENIIKKDDNEINVEKTVAEEQTTNNQIKILTEIEVLLPRYENKKITENFLNALELSINKKSIKNITFNINKYSDNKNL